MKGLKAGMVVLSVWLILTGAISLFNLSFDNIGVVMDLIAIAAGVLILARK